MGLRNLSVASTPSPMASSISDHCDSVGISAADCGGCGGTPAVVEVNVSDTPPTVNIVFVGVPGVPADVCRTQTVCPFEISLATAVNVPEHPTEYSPPATLIGEGALMPVMVTLFDTISVEIATPVTSVNANGSGVVSTPRGLIVSENGSASLLIALVAVIVKLKVPAVVGVPVIAPVVAFSVSPAGNAPVVTLKVMGALPVAAIDCA